MNLRQVFLVDGMNHLCLISVALKLEATFETLHLLMIAWQIMLITRTEVEDITCVILIILTNM